MTSYAHTGISGTLKDGQTLQNHLAEVARRCSEFAKALGYEYWGYALGLLHDAGKASTEFQRRLAGSSIHVDHATAGAQLCAERYDGDSQHVIANTLMSLAIVGHHGGMPNVITVGKRTPLVERLKKQLPQYKDEYLQLLVDSGLRLPNWEELEPLPVLRSDRKLPEGLAPKSSGMAACHSFSLHLLGRLLYSCLVDADYLDTERFVSPEVANLRKRKYRSLKDLLARFEKYMARFQESSQETAVNKARSRILADCFDAASLATGLFTLSVPTGGGKTLSSVQFALRHAVIHGKRRVIYAIPFTSVAHQTAKVFCDIFGEENVLEHHSARVLSSFEDIDDQGNRDSEKAERLATQNWDAPIVVTTNVQLFESLYACTPSKCRKLHNIVNSVIVLDEAQTLPDGLLKPTLAMLEDLCIDFAVSVVLCTATQPALDGLWPFASRPREIAVHTESFDEAFSGRVQFTPITQLERRLLAEEIITNCQVLCVVGTKKKARDLYNDVVQVAREAGTLSYGSSPKDEGFFHLSTNMVAAHRMQVIECIHDRLLKGERCIVISTQLIEAGVDVDFPEVYRELAGIDSLLQVAGRCNREGKLRDNDGNLCAGTVHVFEYEEDLDSQESGLVRTWLGSMKSIARNLIEENGGLVSEDLVKPFFISRYRGGSDELALDRGGILKSISGVLQNRCRTLEYERYASEYHIIEDETDAVYIPWNDEARHLIDFARRLSTTGESAALFMPLQHFAVGVYPHIIKQLLACGAIEVVGNYYVLLQESCITRYSEETGLLPVEESEPNSLII